MKRAADLFCGAGGTTTGLLRAAEKAGVPIDMLAINHWNLAIETHLRNHPQVRHLCETLDGVDPRKVVMKGKLHYLAASPECTHHSIARGGKPCSDQSRASAWHVVRWAEAVAPDHIVVENVKEFRDWGPLCRTGKKPLKSKKGQTFAAFLQALDSLGYHVDHRLLNAADFGDATTRTRLFIQAWRTRRPTWPAPTHEGRWRPAREVIDWELKGESIFRRKKPMSPNTMRRIFAGLRKFSGLPFTVGIDQTGANGNYTRSVEVPIQTLVTKNNVGLCEPWLVNLRGTEQSQIENSARPIGKPLPTFTAGGGHIGLCEPFILPQRTDGRIRGVSEPVATITTVARQALVQPFLIGQQSGAAPRAVSEPMPTIATAGAIALAEPFLTKFYGTGSARPVTEPLDTITTKDRFGLCLPTVEIEGETYVVDVLFRMLQPHELKRAMGFGDEYQFAGTKGDQVKQIGNAVAVGTSEALFLNIMQGGRC